MRVVVLAGGTGTRLWPISRDSFPKQFLKIGDDLSFLQKTMRRFAGFECLVVTSADYQHLVRSQIGASADIVLEPARKNTAPAIAFAVKALIERGISLDETVLVAASDCVFSPEEELLKHFKIAEELALQGKIVTFGIKPTRPDTGYGYIKLGEGYNAQGFIEKPPLGKAQEFVASGDYLWNIGIYVFTIRTFLQEVEKYAPSVWTLQDKFEEMPNVSIDFAITEKTQNLAVIPLELAWSDVGSWDSIFDLLAKDPNSNAKIGHVVDIDTKNSLIIGGKRLISTVGLEDMVVIETEDALFLGKKGESQRVKGLVEELVKRGKKESLEHTTIYRPWGHYTVLENGPRYKVKRIVVEPGQILSLQMHYHRSEHWVVVKGAAKVTIGEKEEMIHENQSIYVPKSTLHRLENPGKVPLEMIEVQVGEYVGEDDIVRFEDIYGRTCSSLSESSKEEVNQ